MKTIAGTATGAIASAGRSLPFIASALVSLLVASQAAHAQSVPTSGTPPSPTASCTVTAMNRTAPLQGDYSFTIYNIPGAATAVGAQNIGNTTPAPPFRVRAVCSDGTVGETNLAFPEFGSTAVYTGELFWRPLTPIPLALDVVAENAHLTSNGTTQLRATGVLANATTLNLTASASGTLYTSSNPLLAEVDENGLVSVAALVASGSSATVVMTGQNEGVAGSAVIEIGPRGQLAGRITKADGATPAPGVQVSILRNQPRETVSTVLADAGGNYLLQDVGAGSFTLSVFDPANGDMGRGSAAIANEGDTGTADIRLNGQGTLTVNVVNGADAAVPNALVTFTSLSGFRDVRTLQTDSAGRAVFGNALAGQFTVSTRDTASNLVGAALGDLLAGANASVTLKLQPIGSISGAVYAVDGATAQADVQVRLVSATRGIITQSVTAADGRFQFDSLPLSDSPFTLDAFQNGRLRTRVPGLILTAGGQQLTQNIVFGPSGTVTGTVLRSNGTAAENATINLQSQVGQRFSFSTRTDAQGRYRIEGVPVGGFGITASGTSGEVASGGGSVASDAQVVTVDLQLAANGIVGTVFQRDGSTPVGAGVSVSLTPGSVTALTNAQGQYAFSVTQPNRYEIQAADAAGNRGRTEVILTTVSAGAPVTANVTFLGRGTVQGVVRDPSQAVQAGVAVSLTSSSVFGGSFSTTTDAQGRYSFENVFVGDFSVYARNASTGLAGVAQSSVAGEANVVTADVTLAATGSVNGQVVAQDNTTPVAGATVELFINGTRALAAVADGTGHFNFAAVPLGDFRLDATNTADGDKGRVVSRITALNEARTANIRLIGLGSARIHAVDESGAAVQGATVTLTSSSVFGGSQTAITDAAGSAVFARVFNGDVSVAATKGSGINLLSGSGVSTVVGGNSPLIELTLTSTPTGTVTGTVTKGLMAEPQSGVEVRLQLVSGGATRIAVTGADGRYQFAQVEVNRDYRVTAYVNQRVRSRADVRLSTAGEVFTRDLALLGVGSVSGTVTNAQGLVQSGVSITLTNSDPTYGGSWSATTQGNGTYNLADIAAGNFTIRARNNDGRLQAQDSGTVRFDGDAVTLNLTLVDSAVTMPVTLYDANGASFDLQGTGAIATGENLVFRGDNAANTQGNRLEIVVNNGAVPFQNGDGSVGRRTQSGQLIEVDEFNQASGLDVTRRMYVPKNGYFARYLEILENRTENPITVGIRVSSNYSSGVGGARVVDSSNSDNVLIAGANGDRWAVIDDDRDEDVFATNNGNPAVVHVFDGTEGEMRAGAAGTSVIGNATRAYWQWDSITIPAGSSVGFLHFTSQQVGRIAARATAERLVQLPPEALEGLSADERAIIRNFRVPADGLSTLQPLPVVEGNTVTGRVFAGDGTTPIGDAEVTFKNMLPYYGRTYRVDTNAAGEFALQSDNIGNSNVRVIARDAFTVFATHPHTQAITPTTIGLFVADQPTATQDLIFAGTGNLRGTVRRHNGAIVQSGSVSIAHRKPSGSMSNISVSINGVGAFQFTGINPGDYEPLASQPHPQGLPITGTSSGLAAVSPSNTTLVDVTMEPTGEVSGIVREADGDPAVGAAICIVSSSNCYRQTTTDTGGRYRFTDVGIGTRTIRASSTGNLTAEGPVTVATDAIAVLDLQLSGLGTVNVQVNYARGVAATNVQTRLSGTYDYRYTDGAGRVSYTVAAGAQQTVTAYHPDNFSELVTTGSTTVAEHGGSASLTLTLPAAGSILGTVVRPDGTTLAAGVSMTLRRQDGSGWQRSSSTTSTGTYRFNGLIPATYTVSAADAATVRFADADAAVTTDGQEVTVNLQLADNRIPLPAELRDANNFQYDIQRQGQIVGGSQVYYNVFSGNGGSQLEINGQAYAGDSSALLEAGRRQFAITQPAPIAGLTVTRKVYVPFGAYFARYMEVLSNPTAEPITVSVRVRNNYYTTNTMYFTSSGDTALQASDTWGVFDDAADVDPFTTSSSGPATAMVLGTTGAPAPHTSFTRPSNTRIEAEWASITVPAGGKRILMHFEVQQVNRAGARAAAERLQQLPPEALQSLTADELANIANFIVPADGVSTVPALPSLVGRVSGIVYEGNGTTIVSQAPMEVRGTHPLFSRTYIPDVYSGCESVSGASSLVTTTTGAYSLNGVMQASGSIALPAGYDVIVKSAGKCRYQIGHPQSYAQSPDHPVTIDATTGLATRNVLFATGILTGRVIGPSDYSVSGAQVQVQLPNVITTVNTNAQAEYRFNGVLAGTYTLNATLSHNQGTALRGSVSATAVVGQTTVTDIEIEPTGSVTGAVVTANGEAANGRSVQLSMTGSSRTLTRTTTTDSLGRFTFTAVPIGNYSVVVTDSATGAMTSATLVVTTNAITTQNLVMIGTGAVQLTVSYARGVTAADSEISLQSSAAGSSYRNVGRTDSLGHINVVVPVGSFTLRVRHPALSSVFSQVSGTVTANNQTQSLTATLPALANVRLTVLDRDAANAPLQSAQVYISHSDCTNCSLGTTDATGRIQATNLKEGAYTFKVLASGGRTAFTGATINAAVDGQTVDKSMSVSINDYTYGTYSFGTERRLYSLTANAGDVIRIGINGYPVNGTVASYLARADVFSPSGSTLARGYGYDASNNYQQYNTSGDLQNIVAPATGTYTIVTYPYYVEYVGGYRLQANVNGEIVQLQPYAGGASVTGTVVRADGTTPAAGRTVQIQTTSPLELRVRTQTAADGTYSFTGVPLGSYHVSALDDGGTQILAYSNGVLNTAGSVATENLRLPPRTTLQVRVTIGSALSVPSQLYFTVSDDTGSRQRGPVTFVSGERTSSTVNVDAYGDSVSVQVTHPNNSLVSSTATITGVDEGTVPVNIDLSAASLSGNVLNVDGEPAAGYYMELSYANAGYISGTYTDSNGHYQFNVVPSGQELTVAVRDDATQVWIAERITPRSGEAEVRDLQLRGQGAIRGRVLRANGSPAAYISVDAEFEYDPRYGYRTYRYAYTDQNGEYRFDSMAVQVPIMLRARIYSDFGDLIATDTVTVPAHEATVTADLTFEEINGSVVARVVATDGSPLPGNCQFYLTVPTPSGESNETTGSASGGCGEGGEFINVPSGAATVRAFETQFYVNYGPVPVNAVDGMQVEAAITTSIVKGTVRYSDGGTAENLSIYPDSAMGGYYQSNVAGGGSYAVYGLPAGDFSIEVQDYDSGLSTTHEGTFLNAAEPLVVDITLPPSATVMGTFLDSNGEPVIEAEVYVRSSTLDFDRYTYTDDAGNYRIERVALGDITVLARDPNSRVVSTASGVLASANAELRIDLAPPPTARVQGTLVEDDGVSVVADVEVTATTTVSYGPFETLSFSAVTDAAGRFDLGMLPLGGLSLFAEFDSIVAQRTVDLDAAGLDVELRFGNDVLLPFRLTGTDTSIYDVACNGQLIDGGFGGAGDAYDGAYALTVDGATSFPCTATAQFRQQRRELVIGPSVLAGLEVSRRVYVPESGGYARYLEVFNNTADSPITLAVKIASNLGSDGSTQLIVSPVSTGNRYAVTRDNGSDPALGHVFASANPALSGTFTLSSDNLTYQWTIVVPAGQQVALLHYAVQRARGDSSSASSQAQALADATQAGMFEGLSSADRASIRNFVVPP